MKNIELPAFHHQPNPQAAQSTQPSFCSLLFLLLHKNYLVYSRKRNTTLFLLLSPFLICLMLIAWQHMINSFSNILIIEPDVHSLPLLPKCTGLDCVSIGYFVIGPQLPYIEPVMESVSQLNQLQFGQDVKFLLQTSNPTSISDYLITHMNKTQIAVIFCTDQWIFSQNISLPCQFQALHNKSLIFYTIMYNYTLLYKSPYLSDFQSPFPKDAFATRLKLSLDQSIINYFTNSTQSIQVNEKSFPVMSERFIQGYDLEGNYGAFYFFAPYIINFLILINELLQEKGKKLRQGLVVMGLSHSIYWLSWAITTLIIVLLLTVILCLSGLALRFDLFYNAPLPIIICVFATFGFSIAIVAFFLAILCPDIKNGYTVGYGFILMTVVMQMFFTQSGMTILFLVPKRLIFLGCVCQNTTLPVSNFQIFAHLLRHYPEGLQTLRHRAGQVGLRLGLFL